ncbi:MAG: hypothetical protein EP344_06080 [Bacteroidetes bacterium]|nr:MAG: hypothetical protein EP344_06080 [Bacteroidota bacterium]
MKNQFLLSALGLFGLVFLLSNCASLTGFQDGRTVGKGNGELSASLNVAQSPDFEDWDDQSSDDNIPTFFISTVELGGRLGVAEKIDLSLRLSTTMNLGVGAKFQVVGDRESQLALALGAEIGTFGLLNAGLWNFQVPLYLSVHPKENFAWYLTPRYIYQFNTTFGAENGINYAGGNTGLLFGNRNKFGLDVGFYNVGTDGNSVGVFQFGLGGRFALGRN